MNRLQDQAGMTLVEIVMSMVILSTVLVFLMAALSPGLRSMTTSRELTQLNMMLNQKASEIKGRGYWVKDLDTNSPAFPGNANDLSEKWKSDLASFGYSRQAMADVTFLKESSSNLLAFSGAEFDGNNPRVHMEITLTLYTSNNNPVTTSVALSVGPTSKTLTGVMYVIKNALDTYKTQIGNYPATLDLLVDNNYLAEIPNDPYTTEKSKNSHKEEVTDWYYVLGTSNVTLAPNSNRTVSFNFGP